MQTAQRAVWRMRRCRVRGPGRRSCTGADDGPLDRLDHTEFCPDFPERAHRELEVVPGVGG